MLVRFRCGKSDKKHVAHLICREDKSKSQLCSGDAFHRGV